MEVRVEFHIYDAPTVCANTACFSRFHFTGKETEAARETLYSLIEKIRAPRPENMAEDIENKRLDLPDLYNTQQN